MNIALRRRLRLPLPVTAATCGVDDRGHGCGGPLDPYGDHALACPRSGALARRAPLVERAWVRIAREAVGADGRVVPQQWIASLNLPGVSSTDRRRLDLVIYGATPLGEALCCDATLVSALTRGGVPIPRAADNDAVAITAARQRKQRAYPELLQRGAQRSGPRHRARWSLQRGVPRTPAPPGWPSRAPRCPCGATRRPQRLAATLVGDVERGGPARHCAWVRLLAPPVAARRRCWPALGRYPRFGRPGCPKPAALSHARGVKAPSLTARFCTEKGVRGKKRNILYLKWSLPLPYWLLDNVLYLKTVVCRTILFSEFEVCKVMIFYLKWSFPLPYWLLDHSFYLNMFCRTILFWELRNGTMNVFYLKLFFPLPHWLLDSIFYFKIVCRIILFWKFWVGIMNISYLKWSLPLPYWLLDNVLYLKTVCRTILFSEFEVCKVMVFYLKWSFPLPYWLLDHSFYIKMFCRTILFWEFRNGTMNVFYLKLFFPLPHWLLDNIFY